LEIENLELANLIRIGKVQTQLYDLLHTLDLLTATLDLGLTLRTCLHLNVALAAQSVIWTSRDAGMSFPSIFPRTASPARLRKRDYAAHARASLRKGPQF
jgi:hypothetical protein